MSRKVLYRRVRIVLNLDEDWDSADLRDWLNLNLEGLSPDGWVRASTVAVFSDPTDYAVAARAGYAWGNG